MSTIFAIALLSFALDVVPFENGANRERDLGPRVVALRSKRPGKTQFLPGWGVAEGSIPSSASVGRIGREIYWFFDLDGDGVLETNGEDGLARQGLPFVVRLPEILHVAAGQFRVVFSETTVELTPQRLGFEPGVMRAASALTTIRLRAGLAPVRVDATASQHCQLHCEYLELNDLSDGQGGLSAHLEEEENPGYTAEGLSAGAGSVIAFRHEDYGDALNSWHATPWHGSSLVDPTVTAVGIGFKHGVCMLYCFEREGAALDRPFLHPAPESFGIPRGFSIRGELPDPIPGEPRRPLGKGCGFPILCRLKGELEGRRLLSARLKDPTGRDLRGLDSCPQRPANPEYPANAGCAVFLPWSPLAPRTRYRAVFTFEGVDPVEWEFTTGE